MSVKNRSMFSLIFGIFILAILLDQVNGVLSVIIGWLGFAMLSVFGSMLSRFQFGFLFSSNIAYTEALYFFFLRSYFIEGFILEYSFPLWTEFPIMTLLIITIMTSMYLTASRLVKHFKIKERIGCVR